MKLSVIIEQLRPIHWVKNLLVFAPLLLAHQLSNTELLFQAGLAFIVLCLAASSIYTINDLADREKDLLHQRKKHRPIPSGRLNEQAAYILAATLMFSALALSLLYLPMEFEYWVGGYIAANVLYSFWFKRIPLVDVLLLAGLFTLRIVSGGAATGIVVSPWLLMFSLFIFGSLAFLKRYIELKDTVEKDKANISGRGYQAGDAAFVFSVGPALGFMAVLVMMLYITSDDVVALYPHPERLWFIVPLLLYWVSRLWLLAHRGGIHDDPVIVAIKDYSSYVVGVLAIIVIVAARW